MSVGIGLLKSLYADGAASFASLYNMGITAELIRIPIQGFTIVLIYAHPFLGAYQPKVSLGLATLACELCYVDGIIISIKQKNLQIGNEYPVN